MEGESSLGVGVSSNYTYHLCGGGLTGNFDETENRYGSTVRSTSGELSSNRKSAGIAQAILEPEFK